VEAALGGRIDILVTNTGGPPPGSDPLGFTRDEWEAAYRTLVLHPLEFVQRVLPAMRARRWGRVLNVASTSVREPIQALMLSNAHRAAAVTAWKTISNAVAGDGVTVNSLLPGRIWTERLAAVYSSREEADRAAAEAVPAGHVGDATDLGAAAAFLASERAGYITGVALLVDGGMTRAV
jgi:3-oxoacyl-[acyl-carrier protein] reductase